MVIGHRGAAGLLPENTLPSFARALEWGCPMLELDVYKASYLNGVTDLVVFHDAKLNRTTNGRGALSQYSIEELRALDAGGGQPIPFLAEVFDLLRRHNENTAESAALNIELKGPDTAKATALMLRTVHDVAFVVSSFNHAELTRFHELMPEAAVAPLYDRYRRDWSETAAKLNASAVNISAKIATHQRITNILSAGYAVYVYTVNTLEEGIKLRDWGASGVFTDRPDILMPLNK